MRPIRTSAIAALALSVAGAVALAGCGSSGTAGAGGSASASYKSGATFTMAIAADPGALDPQASAVSALFQLSQFAYDNLVAVSSSGQTESELAKAWKVSGTTVTFDLNPGITCSDGSAFTAQTAADNINYVENPKNKSPFLGVFVPAGAKATASGSTITVKLAAPAPFVLDSFANLPMVCDSGLKDRSTLKAKTEGTGPYVLSEAVPGNHYTYTLRKGYTWGPDAATTATSGMPATIVVKVVSNETTAANELLAGTLNATQVLGPDSTRLSAQNVSHVDTKALIGEQFYNEDKSHLTSDPAVRMALTQGADYSQLEKVLTSNKGVGATQLAVIPPTGCTTDSVAGNVPAFDTSAADAALRASGWVKGSDGVYAKGGKPLKLTFIYDSSLGTGGSAAAELAVSAWKKIGIDVTAKSENQTQVSGAMFGTGDWDILWEPININTPDQVVPFLSGATLAKGGENFASIDNATYDATTAKAMAMNGPDGCPTWMQAESALFKAADVVPFANNVIPTFAKGAQFDIVGEIVPTSIRMLG